MWTVSRYNCAQASACGLQDITAQASACGLCQGITVQASACGLCQGITVLRLVHVDCKV